MTLLGSRGCRFCSVFTSKDGFCLPARLKCSVFYWQFANQNLIREVFALVFLNPSKRKSWHVESSFLAFRKWKFTMGFALLLNLHFFFLLWNSKWLCRRNQKLGIRLANQSGALWILSFPVGLLQVWQEERLWTGASLEGFLCKQKATPPSSVFCTI